MAWKNLFPDPLKADSDGLLAAGGDLSVKSLLTAYAQGIFPWFDDASPILWWCPDPRMVLFPEKISVSRNLARKMQHAGYEIRLDEHFEEVIRHCAAVRRKGQSGTWITGEMEAAYIALHKEGYAHSVETYMNGKLIGGLYGVSLGSIFFGESMFHLVNDASKIALVHLTQLVSHLGFDVIDTQQSTAHLKSMGAEEIPRIRFLEMVSKAMQSPTIRGKWSCYAEIFQ